MVSAALAGLLAPVMAFGGAGDLDPSFGANGIVQTTLTSGEDRANAAALQPDGKIIAAGGYFPTSSTVDFAVVRYLPNGLLDPAFGTGGFVHTDVPYEAEVSSVALQADGKIVAVGATYDGTGYHMVLARYDASGTLDPTFGSGGIVLTDLGPGVGYVLQVLLQPDGKILTVGYRNFGGDFSWAMARFNPDGTPDATFGTGGEVITDLVAGYDPASSAVLQPDGRIVVVGGRNFQMAIIRYETDGSIDTTFGSGGILLTPTSLIYAVGVALQADGKIVAVGNAGNGDNTYYFVTVRANSDGTMDTSFGTGGVVVTDVGALDDYVFDVAVQPSGKILVSGQVETAFFTSSFGLVRYMPDGTLDAGFGTGGIATTPFGVFSYAAPGGLLLQPDGRVVLAGSKTNFGPRDFLLTRYFAGDCGNGTLELGEQCDDGNTLDGDCCTQHCALDPAGTACTSDGDACTNDQCDAGGTCGHTAVTCALCETCDSAIGCYDGPRAGCLGIAPGGKSSFQVKDRVPNTGDVARWKWQSGLVAIGDFGNPLTTDDYALCVYQGAGQTLWARRTAPAGGACHFRPCWKALAPNGAKYADRELTPDGVSSLLLRSNVPGRVQLKWKAKGLPLALPSLGSLSLPVRVQLQRTGGACWDVTYATAKTATAATFAAAAQ
jgi:uncharacterized delta-60 repeat protein